MVHADIAHLPKDIGKTTTTALLGLFHISVSAKKHVMSAPSCLECARYGIAGSIDGIFLLMYSLLISLAWTQFVYGVNAFDKIRNTQSRQNINKFRLAHNRSCIDGDNRFHS